jgi:mannose-6-phosphate isomerase-like protein (cupin superfamily)
MRISAITGAKQLCIFEQWREPGTGAPTHLHAVEEILTVLQGEAEFWLDDERSALSAGQSVIVPAGAKHGFQNVGRVTLHVQATLAAPIFEASFDDQREVSRRWVPQTVSQAGHQSGACQ